LVCFSFPSSIIQSNQEHAETVYFKSTDGHYGKWDFSLKRTNLHILSLIGKNKGIIFVDTTRKGKRYPDSLSKTIPIWCSVLNRIISNELGLNWDTELKSTPLAVPHSERHHISEMISTFVDKLQTSNIDAKVIAKHITKPLRPLWIDPSSEILLSDYWGANEFSNLDFFPVICVSASISNLDDPSVIFKPNSSFEYMQGAADDSESWAPGFLPCHFWSIRDYIDDGISLFDLQILVSNTISKLRLHEPSNFDWIGQTNVAIGSRKAAAPPSCWSSFDVIVNCGAPPYEYDTGQQYLYLDIPEGKKGQKQLYSSIPIVLAWVKPFLEEKKRILFHCMQGKDRSVGICVALFEQYFDGNGFTFNASKEEISKSSILNKLLFIQQFRSSSNPSRATMKKINLYFLGETTNIVN
jgi:tRNA A64-2'-O-ribosylphosphate transferase